MAGMNIQQRTVKTVSPLGLPTAPDVARAPRDEWLRAHEDSLAVTYEHVGVGIAEIDRAGRMLRVNQKVCGGWFLRISPGGGGCGASTSWSAICGAAMGPT